MKYKSYLLLVMVFFLCQCAHHHKITYNIPPTMPEPQRTALIEKLDKGKELYKENCSECHGIFTKGKDNIPNFTNQQFDNYSMRFLRRDPKNHAVMAKMSMEQYNELIDFLKFKRPENPDSVKMSPGMRGRR